MVQDKGLNWKSILNTIEDEEGYGIEEGEVNYSDIEELEGLESEGEFDVRISQEEIDELGKDFEVDYGYYDNGKEYDVYNLLEGSVDN